jgi:hypothetical protein
LEVRAYNISMASSSPPPKSKGELIQSIVDLASSTDKFTVVKSEDTDLVVEKKIVDAAIDKPSGAEKVAKTYRAYILFDESSHEAKYNEELTESSANVDFDSSSRSNDNSGIGTMSFGMSKKFFRGRMFAHKETRKTWGSKGDTMPSKVIDYSFDVKSIRSPIENLVSKSGWKLVQVISRSEVSYKKKGRFRF